MQKGLSEDEFDRSYETEEQCETVVIELRWRDRFFMPVCGEASYSVVERPYICVVSIELYLNNAAMSAVGRKSLIG